MKTAREVLKATQVPHVDAAVAALRQCFTYDAPEKWRPHYTVLLFARVDIRKALRPAFALSLVIIAIWLVYAVQGFITNGGVPWWTGLVPCLAVYSIQLVMERVNPLLRRTRVIEDACRPFDAMAQAKDLS